MSVCEKEMGFTDVAEALGQQARRQLLLELLEHNPVADNGIHVSDGSDLQLIHTHLPKLDNMGYIDWNRAESTVVKGPNWEEIEPVVQLLDKNREQIPADTF